MKTIYDDRKMIQIKKNIGIGQFGEQYWVKFNYQKPDGYWKYGEMANVVVPVSHGVNEKIIMIKQYKW